MRFLFALFLLLGLTSNAEAASLYMDPSTATLNRGDAVTISVRLDTDEAAGECVNAIDGIITYDPSITPVDISVGKSIFPIWVEAPVINKEKHTITFAGGIPNGYCGRVQGDPNLTNTITELVFRAPGLQVGGGAERLKAHIGFAEGTTVYLNDGSGSKAPLQTYGADLALTDNIGSEIKDPWSGVVADDTISPEPFSITLEHDATTFNGKYYIVFNTTDKQTGLSHYEVIEETPSDSSLFRFGAANSPWVEARSPYVLKDQSLESVVRVRAVDKAGNTYIAAFVPDESLRTGYVTKQLLISAAAATVMVMLALIFGYWFWRKRRQRVVGDSSDSDKREDSEESDTAAENKAL